MGYKMTKQPFDFNKSEDSPGFSLWQTTMVWQRHIKKALEPHGVSHAQFVILATLLWFELHNFQATQIQIVDWTKLDKMTISKSLKRLVGWNFAQRVENEKDTRAKTVSLTTVGRLMAERLVPIVEAIDSKFFGRINKDNQQILIKLLAQLTDSNDHTI
jgi:DNA-binding MarR family transcriptional regulator